MGHYGAAKKIFRAALLHLNHFYIKQCHGSSSDDHFCPIVLESCRIPEPLKKLSNTSQYIYRHALLAHIDHNPPQEYQKPRTNMSGLSAMLIFNLSLVYHYHIDQHDSSASEQMKVLRMYRRAWSLLTLIPLISTPSQQRLYHESAIFGVLNNMGAIFHNMGRYDHARYCFAALKTEIKSNGANCAVLKPEARHGMIMNLFFLKEPKVARAA